MKTEHNYAPGSKLLRIEISNRCNYDCVFCCWKKSTKNKRRAILSSEQYKFIVETAIATGCKRFHLTGGEPLLISKGILLKIISSISSIKDVEEFWITTNGSLLKNNVLCEKLKGSGLKLIAISIAAENNTKYKAYTKSVLGLNDIIKGVKNCINVGIRVQVLVPINAAGIKNYKELQLLIKKLRPLGVKNFYFFELHKTLENENFFDNLYVNPLNIIEDFSKNKKWKIRKPKSNRFIFSNNDIEVMAASGKITASNSICERRNCGHFCQGSYAAYLICEGKKVYIRACHREFENGENEFNIPYRIIKSKNKEKLKKIFYKVWKYPYIRKPISDTMKRLSKSATPNSRKSTPSKSNIFRFG